MNLGYFISRGLLFLTNQSNPKSRGYFDIDLLCKFTSKGHLYPKNKLQEVTGKIMNVLHTGIQGYYSRFKY